jgi:hypothetical protein
VNVVQTIGIIVAASVSGYAVAATEVNRRREARLLRVERVLAAVLELAEAAVRVQEIQGQGARFQVARIRLKAELQIVGMRGFEHVDLMVRDTASASNVVAQSEQAILEVGARLRELEPRPLWRRQPQIDFRERVLRH